MFKKLTKNVKSQELEFKKIQPTWKLNKSLKVFTTTNEGQISTGAYAGFNSAHHTGANLNEVKRARDILSNFLQRPINWLTQVHGIDVSEKLEPEAKFDAAILRSNNYAIAIQTADCLPLVLANKEASEVAILHCGWRGLAKGIIKNCLMRLNSAAKDLSAWFGPCIDVQNYQVGTEVWQKLVALNTNYAQSLIPSPHKIGHYNLDLIELAKIQLIELGVEDFYFSNISSFDDPRFYSHRQNPQTGRNVTIAYLDH